MCGINGFNWADEKLILAMNEKIRHRGPDGTGALIDPRISLGHDRLAILDLTPAGKQPMTNASGSVAVIFNGEIYNFQELRLELQKEGYKFISRTDTEVILHAYEAWGIECVRKFNGIFAIALWDSKTETLFLIRDHVGVKPLYYYWDHGKLVFSSEIKAILEHPVPRRLNLDAMNIYFRALYVPAPLTMFQNIFKVEHGTYLVYKDKTIESVRYWRPSLDKAIDNRIAVKEKILTLMRDSVKRQMISERTVGVFLSGGIDSTAILGLACEQSPQAMKTFSVGFDVAPEKFNADLLLARETAKHFGTDHHELIVTGADCAKYLPEVVYQMDEPVANATQVATHLLSRLARQEIVVALGGDGGDELFGGYERYRLSRLITLGQLVGGGLLAKLFSLFPIDRHSKFKKLALPGGCSRYAAFMFQKENHIANILDESINKVKFSAEFFQEHYFSDQAKDKENELMWADIRSWLTDESLVRSDKLSMAWALEQRVPILDYRLVELSLSIPSAWKLRGWSNKSLFKEAMRAYLPPHVLSQPKRGWASPASHWLRTDLQLMMEEALSPAFNPDLISLFKLPKIRTMFESHVKLAEYHMNLLWAFLTFQLWAQKFKVGL